MEQILATQELSTADVIRMQSEKVVVEDSLEATLQKRDEIQALVDESEMQLAKRHQATEQLLHGYHGFAERLRLLPSSSPNANGVDFTLSAAKGHLISTNLKSTIRPCLLRLRESQVARCSSLVEERAVAQDQLDAIEEQLVEMRRDEAQLQTRLKAMEAQLAATKDAYAKENANAAEMAEALERQLMDLKQGGGEGSTRLQNTILDLKAEHSRLLANDEVQKYCEQTIAMLEALVVHKSHIETKLEELKALAAEDLAVAEEAAASFK